jgi:hypothetical protein
MSATTRDELRGDNGWVPTNRLRWLDGTLQQKWIRVSTAEDAWRDVPKVTE